MNEDEATRLFHALGEGVPDRRPPVPELVAAGRTAVRRRNRRTMALAAASVAVVLGGGAVLQQVTADDERRGVVTNPGPEDDPTDDSATEDVRLVGGHSVVVEVPRSWVADDGCRATRGALLNVREPGAVDDSTCGAVRSLAVFDAESALGRSLSDYPLDDRVVGGVEVLVGDSCLSTAACIYPFGQVVVVPSEDVVMLVSGGASDDVDLVEGVVSSLQVLPDGLTVMPYIQPGEAAFEAFGQLIRSGLMENAELIGIDGYVPDGSYPSGVFVHSTLPEAGSVLHRGDPVKVLVTDSEEDATTSTTPIGNATLDVGETRELLVPTHCGLELAMIDGSVWRTEPRGNGSPPVGATDPSLIGEATRTAEDRVEVAYPAFEEPIVFRPAPAGTELPGCF